MATRPRVREWRLFRGRAQNRQSCDRDHTPARRRAVRSGRRRRYIYRGPCGRRRCREGRGRPRSHITYNPDSADVALAPVAVCAAVVDSPVCVAVFAGRAKRRGWLVPQQLRELGDIDGYAPGLFAGQ